MGLPPDLKPHMQRRIVIACRCGLFAIGDALLYVLYLLASDRILPAGEMAKAFWRPPCVWQRTTTWSRGCRGMARVG